MKKFCFRIFLVFCLAQVLWKHHVKTWSKCFSKWKEKVWITIDFWVVFYVSFVDDGTWDTLRYLKIPHENCLLQQYSVCFLNEPKTKTKKLERINRTSRRNTLLSVSCVLLNCSCFNVNVAWIIHDCLRIFSGFLFGSKTLPTSRQNRI